VAEDLVERSAYLTFQNMKIDPLDHVTALDKTIGKTKLFKIGMSGSETPTFAIKYVLKKCLDVDASQVSITVTHAKVTSIILIYYYYICYLHIFLSYKTLSLSCHLQTTTPIQIVE
jgi:hypothetical protein